MAHTVQLILIQNRQVFYSGSINTFKGPRVLAEFKQIIIDFVISRETKRKIMEISLYTIFLIVLGFMAGAIPVFIIFSTLKKMRKKRESQTERMKRHQKSEKDLYHNIKSVKEERVENKNEINKTKN